MADAPKYELVIRIPLDALDDIGAREEADKILYPFASLPVPEGCVTKLQCVYKDKPPRGVPIL